MRFLWGIIGKFLGNIFHCGRKQTNLPVKNREENLSDLKPDPSSKTFAYVLKPYAGAKQRFPAIY
jgi:hypothetical protein